MIGRIQNGHKAIAGILIVLLASASLAWFASKLRTKADGSAQVKIVPTPEQQKPIKDLMAEQKRLYQSKQDEISGAVKMLMSQLKDPITGQVGLDPVKWRPVAVGEDGFEIIQVPQPAVPAQPSQEGGK